VLVDVKRPKVIWVEFIDGDNRHIQAQLSGMVARVFQHEYDHLQGKLILDYLPPKDRQKILLQMKDGSYPAKVLDEADDKNSRI
jgi:peptide deformylase